MKTKNKVQELSVLFHFAERLAKAATKTTLPLFRTSLTVQNKKTDQTFDPVTIADRKAEISMREMIMEDYPDHGIIGEEYGSYKENAEYVWVLDPIDGTRNFISGFPLWGTLIGLLHQGQPILGLMNQPFTGEQFFAFGGQAFFKRTLLSEGIQEHQQILKTQPCNSLREALATTTSPDLFASEREQKIYDSVKKHVKNMRFGGDCYGYAMLATGRMNLVIETGLSLYDIAPLIPIVTGAGGYITDWEGNGNPKGGEILATSDAQLHKYTLDLLKKS
ncbi:MAG: histidinol-phosphatase [Alphaproteobacteria bacterium]|nr:histidinol-phosphatase [Alphaproteobacteria bacterium]